RIFRNQYIATSAGVKPHLEDIEPVVFGGLRLYPASGLSLTVTRQTAAEVALIGPVIDTRAPQAAESEIARKLAEKCLTAEDLFREIMSLSGRYVLLYKNARRFLVTGDACHLRQIYYRVTPDQT